MPIPTLSYYIQKARHRFNYKFAVQVMKYRKTKVCNRRSRDVEFTGKKKKKGKVMNITDQYVCH